ncbi:hypothetical protein [Actinomadura macrotermitis]|uniref:Uncharacterized protein n=1 Tax=Actinomadura macrotermitis TaxID=2585200 RepID=A0A7K0C1B5_9ACTN|nr:hypothetical protein [Actinomadura macrotermitis]MQY07258.1 hypothetical protein [Actinomadura macrotermitis]
MCLLPLDDAPDPRDEAIAQIGTDLAEGYLDSEEAFQRLLDLGHTPAGAQRRITDWLTYRPDPAQET